MNMPTDLMFHYTSLFGQDLSKLEEALYRTSCMNPDDAELIGLCLALIKRSGERNAARATRLKNQLIPMLEIIGMSKWQRGEVTQLALRLGHRNKKKIKLSSDTDTEDEEVEPNADSDTT